MNITVDDVAAAGGSTHTAHLVFSDNKKVKADTITADAFSVTGPDGSPLHVANVGFSPNKDSKRIEVTLTFDAPGGSWDAADDGRYRIHVLDGKVTDLKGNAMGSSSHAFRVRTAVADGAAPTASISTDDVTDASAPVVVSVTYSDDIGLNLSTIGRSDLEITGPGGSVEVDVVDVDSNSDDTRATVRYTLDGPFDFGRNGTFTVRVKDGAVKDSAGNGVGEATDTFEVNLPAPPVVDPGFTPAPVALDFVSEGVAVQSSGGIVLAGRLGEIGAGNAKAALQRFLTNGANDDSFGSAGRIVSDANANDAYFAVATQSDDKILAAGTSGGDFLVVRYNADGSIDMSFGDGGRKTIDLGATDDIAYGLALDPDGSMVLAGGSAGNFAFAKLSSSGALDESFGIGGRQLFDLGGTDVAGGVAVQSDGKVVAAGSTDDRVAAVRLTATGEADSSFSGDGLLMLDGVASRAGDDRSQGVAIDASGRIVLGNHTTDGDFSVLRLNADGTYDGSFGTGGAAGVDLGGDDDVDAIVLQPDGQILALGTSLSGGQGNTAVVALDDSGGLITSFGNGGKLVLAPEAPSANRELHVGDLVVRAFGTRQPDGSVVVGTSNSGPRTQPTPALRRLNVPGTRATPKGSKVAEFGIVGGRKTAYTFTDEDGTAATFTLKNGTASVWLEGETLSLVIADSGGGASLMVRTAGGDGRMSIGGITVNGSLKSLNARTVDLTGTLYTTAIVGKVLLGNITGTIAAGGGISSITADSLNKARVFSGAMLGTDGKLGGTAAEADTFASGYIGKIKINGAITDSLVSAGLNPVDGTFANGDDVIAGGAESQIRSITAASADDKSKFYSGTFGRVRIGDRVDVVADTRFKSA